MSQLTDNLYTIDAIKSGIRSAIEEKGVDMTGLSFPDYPAAIASISGGGGDYTQEEITMRTYDIVNLENSASFVGSYAFIYDSKIQTVSLPDCTNVGYSAFGMCPSLAKVDLPVCSYVGAFAFQYCSSLSEVSLPVCSYISTGAFQNCSSLSEVSLPVCSYISNQAFYYCTTLKKAYLPNCLEIRNSAFAFCTDLSELTIGLNNYDILYYNSTLYRTALASGVGSIYVDVDLYSRYIVANGWSSLSERFVGIGDPDDYLLSYDNGLVYGKTMYFSSTYKTFLNISAEDVVSLSLSKCISFNNGSDYYTVKPPLQSCYNLEYADLPMITEAASFMFNNCSKLSYVSLPVCGKLNSAVFYNCGTLSQIDLPVCTYVGISAFGNCSSLTQVSLPVCSYVGGLAFCSCFSISQMDLPACTYVDYNAFQNCSSLTQVSLPVCTYVGPNAFQNCSSLTQVSLPVCTYVDYNAFQNCSSLTQVSLPACTYVDYNAFQNCSSLTQVDLPVCSYVGGSAFLSCLSLTQVSLPVCTYVGDYAFVNCRSLTQVDLPVCSYVGGNAFVNCSSISQVSLPVCSYVGAYAFQYCSSISQVSLPACSYIGSGAFQYCSSITLVDLSVCSYIGNSAFEGCNRFNEIVVRYSEGVCEINDRTFSGTQLSSGYIYVPESLVEDYKVAQYWSSFYSNIYPILSDLQFSNGLVYGWASSMNSGFTTELGINKSDVLGVSMSRLISAESGTFKDCYNLNYISIPGLTVYNDNLFDNTGISEFSINASILGNSVFANCTSLENVYINYMSGVITAGNDIFSGCTSLLSIAVPYGMLNDYISAPGWSQYSSLMYEDMPLLSFDNGLVFGRTQSLDNTYLRTLNITSNQVISVSLPYCLEIKPTTFNEHHNVVDFYLPNVTSIGNSGMFGCNMLNSISLPNCSYIGTSAFMWCAYNSPIRVLSITLGYSSVVSLGSYNVFTNTPSVSVFVPASLVNDYKTATYWSLFWISAIPEPELAFDSTTGLLYGSTSVLNASTISQMSELGVNKSDIVQMSFSQVSYVTGFELFANCTNLTSVSLPICENIGTQMFENCTSLTDVSLPACSAIDPAGFRSCTALSTINLPVCSTIGLSAFKDTALNNITLGSNVVCSVKSNTFVGTPIAAGTGSIYVPASLVNDYKAANYWSDYSSQIFSIQ